MKRPMEQPPTDPYYEEPMNIAREKQDAELTRWQLETVDEIDMFKRSLKGEVWSDENKKWIEQKGARLLNNQGVEVIAAELRDRVNKISTLSNLSSEDIYNIVQRFEINLARLLVINYETWEIKNPSFLYSIRDKSVEFLFIGLQRCKDKTFLNFLERAKQYMEQRRIVAEERRRSKFSPMG